MGYDWGMRKEEKSDSDRRDNLASDISRLAEVRVSAGVDLLDDSRVIAEGRAVAPLKDPKSTVVFARVKDDWMGEKESGMAGLIWGNLSLAVLESGVSRQFDLSYLGRGEMQGVIRNFYDFFRPGGSISTERRKEAEAGVDRFCRPSYVGFGRRRVFILDGGQYKSVDNARCLLEHERGGNEALAQIRRLLEIGPGAGGEVWPLTEEEAVGVLLGQYDDLRVGGEGKRLEDYALGLVNTVFGKVGGVLNGKWTVDSETIYTLPAGDLEHLGEYLRVVLPKVPEMKQAEMIRAEWARQRASELGLVLRDVPRGQNASADSFDYGEDQC